MRLLLGLIALPGLLIGAGGFDAAVSAQSFSVVRVQDGQALRRAVAQAKPGTRIVVAPGDYVGGLYFDSVHGQAGRPIVIAGEDPARPPVIRGGSEGMHFT